MGAWVSDVWLLSPAPPARSQAGAAARGAPEDAGRDCCAASRSRRQWEGPEMRSRPSRSQLKVAAATVTGNRRRKTVVAS